MKLIPFDLGKALAGAEVRTRDGRRVTKLHLVRGDEFPLKGAIKSLSINGAFTRMGCFWADIQSENDLFLVEPEREPIWTCGTRWPENKFAGKGGV